MATCAESVLGFVAGEELGRGSTGLVRRASPPPTGVPGWAAAGPVALKTWPDAAVGAYALQALADIAAAAPALCGPATGAAAPFFVVPGGAPAVIMPVVAPVCAGHSQELLAVVARLLDPAGLLPLGVVHTDIKAANFGVLDDRVVLIDHDAFARNPGPHCHLGSYSPVLWYRWHPPPPRMADAMGGAAAAVTSETVAALRESHPAVYDDFYYTCADGIATVLENDPAGNRALMRYGALATLITLQTGHGNPIVTRARVARLRAPGALEMYRDMLGEWAASGIGAAAAARGAALI